MGQIIDRAKIERLFLDGKLSMGEWSYLTAYDNEDYMQSFLTGGPSYRIDYDSSVPPELYFTNLDEVFRGIYSIYNKYPELHVDKRLYNSLDILSKNSYKIYEFLTLISYQVRNEKRGISPFHIESVPLLKNCKKNLLKKQEILSRIHDYVGANKKDGQMGAIREYNEDFKQMLDYDLMSEDDDDNKKTL